MHRSQPLYKQVKQRITESLRDGKWRHGQAIPSEPLLAKGFNTSVGTVRKAVDELVAENILVRQQGRGTFVTSHTRDYMLNVFFQIVNNDGHKKFPQPQMLSFKRGRADVATGQLLGIARGEPVFMVQNLLRLQGEPVILDNLRLPARLFPDMSENLFVNRDTTTYGLYQMRYGITVVRTVETISAVIADAKTRKLLGMARPAAVLRIVRTAYTYKDIAVDTRVRFVNTERHHYLSLLGKR
jgi:GntR family transcriptional regulator